MEKKTKAFIATPFELNPNLPLDFPWITFKNKRGIMWKVREDVNTVKGLEKELKEINNWVQRDANKWKLKFSEITVTVEFE